MNIDNDTITEDFDTFCAPDEPWRRGMQHTIGLTIDGNATTVMTSGRMRRRTVDDEGEGTTLPDEPPPGWAER